MLLVPASGFEKPNKPRIMLFLTGGKELNSNSTSSHLKSRAPFLGLPIPPCY